MIVLMRRGDESAIIQRWLDVASQVPDDHIRASLGALAKTLSEVSGRYDIWSEALKEWNVMKSTAVEEWKAEGRNEGIAEGKAEGQWESSVEMLLQILRAKYTALPQDLEDAVRATKDVVTLQGCVPLFIQADTLDAFRKAANL